MKKLIYILALIAFFAGCSTRHYDPRLEEINNLASENPQQAIARLDSIDVAALPRSDRSYYDFLTIKAKDKAFVTHTSDSLIKKVLNYTASSDKKLYPEALYYGGRVYSDLGDYPTALSYYQQSLDLLEDDNANLKLKGNVLGQTASILSVLKMYDESNSYINQSLVIDSILNDSIKLMADFQLFGTNSYENKNYGLAEKYFTQARTISIELNLPNQYTQQVYLAVIKQKLGKNTESLELIDNVKNKVWQKDYNWALAHSINIYLANDYLDSAYIYAKELIKSKNNDHKKVAYYAILSNKLIKYTTKDSLIGYVFDYKDLINQDQNKSNSNLTINRINNYNYKIQQRLREQSVKESEKYKAILIFTLIILVVAVIVFSMIKYKDNLKFRVLKSTISNLENRIEEYRIIKNSYHEPIPVCDISSHSVAVREKLITDLINTFEKANGEIIISSEITSSEIYAELQDYFKNNRAIGNNSIWDNIEDYILKLSPDFKTKLQILTNNRLTDSEYKTALLIKLGISPSQMKVLLSITPGSVTSRRTTLCEKIFGKNKGIKMIDFVINSL